VSPAETVAAAVGCGLSLTVQLNGAIRLNENLMFNTPFSLPPKAGRVLAALEEFRGLETGPTPPLLITRHDE
jgi:hypothetical protein